MIFDAGTDSAPPLYSAISITSAATLSMAIEDFEGFFTKTSNTGRNELLNNARCFKTKFSTVEFLTALPLNEKENDSFHTVLPRVHAGACACHWTKRGRGPNRTGEWAGSDSRCGTKLSDFKSTVWSVSISSDGQQLAGGSHKGLRVWDFSRPQELFPRGEKKEAEGE